MCGGFAVTSNTHEKTKLRTEQLGLELMRVGRSAPDALKGLLVADSGSAVRQVAMIDAQRSYEMDSRAIQNQDQMMQVANQIRQ